MRRLRGLVLAVTVGLVLAGCTTVSGPATNEDREVGAVQAVELATAGDLVVVRGDRPALSITAPEQALARLTSDVTDGRLVLGSSESLGIVLGQITYLLETDHLDEITVRGSGDVTGSQVAGDTLTVVVQGSGGIRLDGMDADRVAVRIEGSGDVELSGAAREVEVLIKGSGNVEAFDLDAQEVRVEVEGSGNAEVAPATSLVTHIAGSGNVIYDGDPVVSSQIEGSGHVAQR